MSTDTLTSKRQITIPVAVRTGTAWGIDTGDRVEFADMAPGHSERGSPPHSR